MLETIKSSSTPTSTISHNPTYYALLIPLVANNPLDGITDEFVATLYVKTLTEMCSDIKDAFVGDSFNTSPFPSCCNAQQFISPPLSALCCRYMSLMFANLSGSDQGEYG